MLTERLAEAREDDTIIDFSDCIDAAESGRVEASIALNEYFLRKMKEAAQSSAAIAGRINTPVRSTPAVSPPSAQKVEPSETESEIIGSPKANSPAEFTPPKRTTTFQKIFKFHSRTDSRLSRASTLLESPPPAGDQPIFAERPNGAIVQKDSAQTHDKAFQNRAPTHLSSYASSTVGQSSAASVQSPKSTLSRRTSFSSGAHTTIYQSEVAPITEYGGCCRSAWLLREGKRRKALERQETFPAGKPERYRTFVYGCSINGCEFQLPAHVDAKKTIVFDERIRQSGGMRYTFNFLAKSHATRKNSNVAIQYRCVFCNLFGFQSHSFNDDKELLSHVATHAGSALGNVKLEGGIVVSNSGVVANKPFDVEFPAIEERQSAQRPWVSPQNSEYSRTTENAEAGSSGRVSPTPWTDEIDVEINHWAREGER